MMAITRLKDKIFNDEKKKILAAMKKIKYDKDGQIDNVQEWANLYDALQHYYKHNVSYYSNFRGLWNKLHLDNRCYIGDPLDTKKKSNIAWKLVVNATALEDWKKISKGILPVIRKQAREMEDKFYTLLKKDTGKMIKDGLKGIKSSAIPNEMKLLPDEEK